MESDIVQMQPYVATPLNMLQRSTSSQPATTGSNHGAQMRQCADGPSERDIVRMQLRSGVVPLGRCPAVALAERRVGILQPYSERVPEKR